MSISRWSRAQLQDGGWIRRMFMEGERLRAEFGEDNGRRSLDRSAARGAGGDRRGVRRREPRALPRSFRLHAQPRVSGRARACRRGRGLSRHHDRFHRDDVRSRVARSRPRSARSSIPATTSSASPRISRSSACTARRRRHVSCRCPPARTCASTSTAISAALSAHTAAVIVNSPSNPSGHVLDGGELSGLARDPRGAQQQARPPGPAHRRRGVPALDLSAAPARRAVGGIRAHRAGAVVLEGSRRRRRAHRLPRAASVARHAETHRGLAQALRALGFVNAPATAQRALLHLDSWEINAVPYRERRDLVHGSCPGGRS